VQESLLTFITEKKLSGNYSDPFRSTSPMVNAEMRIHNSKWLTNLRQAYYLSGGNVLPGPPKDLSQ